jgi:hypothetical protein
MDAILNMDYLTRLLENDAVLRKPTLQEKQDWVRQGRGDCPSFAIDLTGVPLGFKSRLGLTLTGAVTGTDLIELVNEAYKLVHGSM